MPSPPERRKPSFLPRARHVQLTLDDSVSNYSARRSTPRYSAQGPSFSVKRCEAWTAAGSRIYDRTKGPTCLPSHRFPMINPHQVNMMIENLKKNQSCNSLDASKLIYKYTQTPKDVPSEASAYASIDTICTDHMITALWKQGTGWMDPELKAYGPLSLFPTSSCLHYATECFEGMKVYAGNDGKLRLFRPSLNARRMGISAARISLPVPEAAQLEKLVDALVSVDGKKWLANRPGSWMYLRPTLIGTHQQLGVSASREAMLFITMSFIAPLHTLPSGMHLVTSPDQMIRAWVGGFGHAKVGANYGPTVPALQVAQADGFHQVLWLYGDEGYCTEAGGSNLFFVWRRADGQRELITAPLENKLILDGVTRRSCVELAQERMKEELIVSQRAYTIGEVFQASLEGRLEESFSTGTAYFISPITRISHRGQEITLPHGEITVKMRDLLEDIMYGREQHEWAKVVETVTQK